VLFWLFSYRISNKVNTIVDSMFSYARSTIIVNLKQFLISLSLLKDLLANASVAGIINKILKLTHIWKYFTQFVVC